MLDKKICKSCGQEVNFNAKFCSKCGSVIPEEKKDVFIPFLGKMNNKEQKYLIITVAIVIFLIQMVILTMIMSFIRGWLFGDVEDVEDATMSFQNQESYEESVMVPMQKGSVTIDCCELVYDSFDGLCLDVTYTFRNITDDTNSFLFLYEVHVFQNGVECREDYLYSSESSRNVAPGAQHTFTDRYVLLNDYQDVEISVVPSFINVEDTSTNISMFIEID